MMAAHIDLDDVTCGGPTQGLGLLQAVQRGDGGQKEGMEGDPGVSHCDERDNGGDVPFEYVYRRRYDMMRVMLASAHICIVSGER